MSMVKRVLVVGMYGAGNIGDDMIFAATLKILKEIDVEVKLSVVSYNIDKFKSEYPDCKVYGISKLEKIKSVYNNDIVLIAGGTACQDRLGSGFLNGILFWYIEYVLLCALLRRKVFFFAIGCDEITSMWGRVYSKMMSLAGKVYVRDKQSFVNISRFVVKKKISMVPDPAYCYNEKSETPYNKVHLDLLKKDGRRKVLVNVLGEFVKDRLYLEYLARLITEEQGTLFVVVNSEIRMGFDHNVALELFAQFDESVPENLIYIGTNYYVPAELMAIADLVDAAIVMRMHLGIMMLNCGKPVFMLSRSDKSKSFAIDNDFAYWDLNAYMSYSEFQRLYFDLSLSLGICRSRVSCDLLKNAASDILGSPPKLMEKRG